MSRKNGIILAGFIAALGTFAVVFYINIQDFLSPTKPSTVRTAAKQIAPAQSNSNVPATASQPATAALRPTSPELPTLAPERRKALEEYHAETMQIRNRYREQILPLKGKGSITKDQMQSLSREEKRALKTANRTKRKEIQNQQKLEIEAIRAKYGITKEEETAYMTINLQERRQAILDKKNISAQSNPQEEAKEDSQVESGDGEF